MKKLITLLLVGTITSTTFAQVSCPLTNVKLTDLRTAASKLSKTITLSPECKAYQDTINQANSNLKDLANKVAATDATPIDPSKGPDAKATALQVVSQLDTISGLFKDQRCGQEAMGFLDYASTFVDLATGFTPFLALYGGEAAMPWVLGTSIGGAAAKSIIMFFQNKNINMRNSDQSNNFLKNSCSFYNLNTIKESLDELELRQVPSIQRELEGTRAKLASHIKQSPSEPSSELAKLVKQTEKDSQKIKFIQDQFKLDPVEGCSYIKAYASKEDEKNEKTALIDRVWNNYERTFAGSPFQIDLERKYFLDDLTPAVVEKGEKDLCYRWLVKITSMHEAGSAAIKKAFNEDPELKTYSQWKEEKTKLEESVKLQEARVKFFDEITGNGFNIEYSEIIRSHQQVQNAIFASYKYLVALKMKGLAEAWLKVKLEDSDRAIDDFKERYIEITKSIKKTEEKIKAPYTKENVLKFAANYVKETGVEHSDVTRNMIVETCNQLRRTWTSWYNGQIHAKAGKDYCSTFERVINKLDYPEVQQLCFGTSKKNKPVKSLRNKVAEFQSYQPELNVVLKKMKELSCQDSESMTTDLLARPF